MEFERTMNGEIFSPNDEGSDTLTYRLLSCVALLRDESPTDLPPLAHTVDPDALESLFSSGADSRCSVALAFAETYVVVEQNGDIRVSPLPETC